MHIKRMHEMIEKLTEYTQCAIDIGINSNGKINLCDVGALVDMIKDLSEAEYKSLISKEMKQYKEEEEAEEKYMMRKLKEEYKDDYKRMREQYGDEEGERRFYDNYRYKSSGRFAPKGRGSYMPRSSGRRGYVEPPYYHMMPEDAEWYRDMDRTDGKMYYTPMSGNSGNMGGSSTNSSGGNMSGNSRGYSDGYDEGQKRGYSEGYEQGNRDGRRNGGNSRYEKAKRGYEETKEMHKGNTPEDRQMTMKEAEKFVNVILDELEGALEDASPEVKNMVKSKTVSKMQKM